MPSKGKHILRYEIFPVDASTISYETTWEITIKDLAEFPELSITLPDQPTPMPEPDQSVKLGSAELPWWNDYVFYEVFVRSFKDSDGDGIGDLPGLISMLDYLNDGDPQTDTDLGVSGLWLMPVAQSPSYHGYDVSDYLTIEEDYGTNQDFKRLMEEAHRAGNGNHRGPGHEPHLKRASLVHRIAACPTPPTGPGIYGMRPQFSTPARGVRKSGTHWATAITTVCSGRGCPI